MVNITVLLTVLYNSACNFQISNKVGFKVSRNRIAFCTKYPSVSGFLYTGNVNFSLFTVKIFNVAKPVKTCYSLGFSSLRNLYPFCSFCMPQFLALQNCVFSRTVFQTWFICVVLTSYLIQTMISWPSGLTKSYSLLNAEDNCCPLINVERMKMQIQV